jgi:hypothetical protein
VDDGFEVEMDWIRFYKKEAFRQTVLTVNFLDIRGYTVLTVFLPSYGG